MAGAADAAPGATLLAAAGLATWQGACALLFAALLVWELRMRWVMRGVRGIQQWQLPIIGHAHIAWKHACTNSVVQFSHQCAKDADFQTYGFRIFNMVWVTGSTPEHVEHMFGKHSHNYIKGPFFARALGDVLGDSIFATDGERWKEHRHYASHLFTTSKLHKRMLAVFEARGRKLTEILLDKAGDGGVFDLQPLLYSYMFDVINEIAFGRGVDSLGGNEKDLAFQRAFDAAQACTAFRNVQPEWAWRAKRALGVGEEAAMRDALVTVNEYLAGAIREREERGSVDDQDLISLFIESCERDGRDYTEKELRDLIMTFCIAGRDTTAALMVWTFHFLCTRPDVLSRVRADISEHLDGANYDEMHYTQAVLQEALRLYPSVPLDFKFARRADTLPCGTRVAAGMAVMFNPYSHQRNPANFADPDEFRPARWLGADGACRKVDILGYTYPAFNAGARTCLGRSMALLEAKVVLAHVVLDVDLALEGGFTPMPRFTITLASANGLRVAAEERSEQRESPRMRAAMKAADRTA